MTETSNISQEQIDCVAKELCSKYNCTCIERDGHCNTPQQHARIILELGYAKEQETAQKVIDEIDSAVTKGSSHFGMFMIARKIDQVRQSYNLSETKK